MFSRARPVSEDSWCGKHVLSDLRKCIEKGAFTIIKKISVGKDVEKSQPLCTVIRENNTEAPQKISNETTIGLSSPTYGII